MKKQNSPNNFTVQESPSINSIKIFLKDLDFKFEVGNDVVPVSKATVNIFLGASPDYKLGSQQELLQCSAYQQCKSSEAKYAKANLATH